MYLLILDLVDDPGPIVTGEKFPIEDNQVGEFHGPSTGGNLTRNEEILLLVPVNMGFLTILAEKNGIFKVLVEKNKPQLDSETAKRATIRQRNSRNWEKALPDVDKSLFHQAPPGVFLIRHFCIMVQVGDDQHRQFIRAVAVSPHCVELRRIVLISLENYSIY